MLHHLIRNRVAEKDVRDWLTQNGYHGKTAEILELELHAIARPGWLQIFRFHLKVRPLENGVDASDSQDNPESQTNGRIELFGSVRDDERERNPERRTRIEVFESPQELDQKLEQLSEGLIARNQRQAGNLAWLFLIAVLILVVCGLIAKMKTGQ